MTLLLRIVDRVRPPLSLLDTIDGDGWRVDLGFQLPEDPWDLTDRRWARWARVDDDQAVVAAVMAAARGVGVVACCVDASLREQLREDLARLGEVDLVELGPDPLDRLDDDQRSLLAALATGSSIAEAATDLFLSTRTAERRLAAARTTLGVGSSAEAIALAIS